jgi:hypothetical protein
LQKIIPITNCSVQKIIEYKITNFLIKYKIFFYLCAKIIDKYEY